jgi:hypothetical protein
MTSPDCYSFDLTDKTVKITPGQLVFAQRDMLGRLFRKQTDRMHNIPFGLVCAFGTDRIDDWNLFVIVGETETEFEIICPRIQASFDEVQPLRLHDPEIHGIKLGQDNMVEQNYVRNFTFSDEKCECYPGQGSSDCACSYNDARIRSFAKTFQEKATPEYSVVKIPKEPSEDSCYWYMTVPKFAYALRILEAPFIY